MTISSAGPDGVDRLASPREDRRSSHRLVLLHPLPLDGSIWSEDLRSLSTSCVAPTLYGFGHTMAGRAEGVLNLAGAGPLVLVGNSIGGSCAIDVARLAPRQVRMIVLIGAKAAHRPQPELCDEVVQVLSEDGPERAWSRYWAPLFAPDADPSVAAVARAVALAQRADDLIRGTQVFHGRADRSQFVASWPHPVVVVSGEHDPTARNGAALAAGVPNGLHIVVAGAGHYVPLERPAELTTIVREALDLAALGLIAYRGGPAPMWRRT